MKNHLASCSVSDFLHFVVSSHPPKELLDDLKRFQKEASPELLKCHNEFCKDFGLWMTLSSPIYTIIGSGIVITLIFFRYVDESTAKRNAIVFAGSESAACAA